jgi:hypothetical protein
MLLFFAIIYVVAVEAVTYNATFTWYGLNDARGSPNCSARVGACGFYLEVLSSIHSFRYPYADHWYCSLGTLPQSPKIFMAPMQEKDLTGKPRLWDYFKNSINRCQLQRKMSQAQFAD